MNIAKEINKQFGRPGSRVFQNPTLAETGRTWRETISGVECLLLRVNSKGDIYYRKLS